MGIEGGSNSEVQNQEINQANNEQNEINQAEHQRSGEELEGNSTIDNEGERKQIEGKDDATESVEDESSQLDKEDNIEDDPNTEQPPESDNVAPEQQLDNQDTIESDPSGADEMGEDNNETVDSLDNDDEIEDSEDLDDNQDSTEGDIQDSLDTEDSIDSDDTDDLVEEDDNNEQDPLDSEDSIEDDGEEESESPEGEEETENPEGGEESETPEKETENPEDGEESENSEEEIENPEDGEELETPEEETENPEDGEESESPEGEEETENPEDDEESENPEGEENTENPEDDEESESPEGEEETENPEDDEESEGPEGEEETENSEGGEESETLEEETENPEESGESDGLEGKEDIENPEKDIDVEPTLDNKLDDIKDAAYEGRDAEGNMTPEAKEKLVDDMKQAYDDTPKEDRGDTLVPEKSEYLKDPPIAENKNTGERYNDVNYDWPSNGGFEGKPEEVTPQVGDRFDRVGAENGRYVAPIEGDTPQPVENRGLPYHFTEDNITDEPSYHSYEVDRDFGQLQDAINEYNNPALTAEENEFMRGEFQKEYDRNNWPSDEYTHESGKTYYGDIAEAFDSGGGTQLELPMSVESLKELGMIHEV